MHTTQGFHPRGRRAAFGMLLAALTMAPSTAGAGGEILTWGGETTVRQERTTNLQRIIGSYGWTLSLHSDGSIIGWGGCPAPPSVGVFTMIAAGISHGVALGDDGAVVAWGSNGYGQCDVPAPNGGFGAVAAGGFSSVALRNDGTLVAWGYLHELAPAVNNQFTRVAVGTEHFLGLRADGSITAWGIGVDGEMNIPAPNMGFIAVSAGHKYSLGLKDDGSIVGWGRNDHSQCNVPAPNSGFVAVAAGWDHALGLRADGSIVVWGNNDSDQAAIPAPNAGFTTISAGYGSCKALRSDGLPVQWGSPPGQPSFNGGFVDLTIGLGLRADGSVANWSFGGLPPMNAGFTALGSASFHLALRSGGAIAAWFEGLLPDPQGQVPLPNTAYVAVTRGANHALAVRADGSIAAWGSENYDGELDVPAPNSGFVAAGAGEAHSLGVKTDGSVVCWGWNDSGQCDVPAPNTDFVAVAGGESHSLGLRSDGSVVAWGDNTAGQCDVPSPNASFVAIAAGQNHSLGLRSDGAVVAWGDNLYGQCNVPPAPEGYIAIAAHGITSAALTGGLVPVALSDCSAQAEPDHVELRWTAVTDAPAQFAVEQLRSPEGVWVEVGSLRVDGPGRHELSHRDGSVRPGRTYTYRIGVRAQEEWTYSDLIRVVTPRGQFVFLGSSPNPARGVAQRLQFELARGGRVQVDVYDVRGRRVRRVVDATFAAGVQVVTWDGRGDDGRRLPAGVYGVRIESNGVVRNGKLVMAR